MNQYTRKINLGCGSRYADGWDNFDIQASEQAVRRWDILRGLPYEDSSVDFVYMSHVLEHLDPTAAETLLVECKRVLRCGGIIRVVVPDLEDIVENYLTELRHARQATPENRDRAILRYRLACVELLDQLTRTQPGGLQIALMREMYPVLPDVLEERFGCEWLTSMVDLTGYRRKPDVSTLRKRFGVAIRWRRRALMERIERWVFKALPLWGVFVTQWRLAGYMKTGERHQWMYDEFSFKRLLDNAGFVSIIPRSFSESAMPDWQDIRLDVTAAGTAYKPHSLYFEALKD